MCRNIPAETTKYFQDQIELARAAAAIAPEALTPMKPQLQAALAQVVQRYEEDPVLAGQACEAWLRVLDSPELVVTVVAVDMLPPYCVRPDMSYLRARALTQKDEQGSKPIPGVRFE